jgi:hypothetical protein
MKKAAERLLAQPDPDALQKVAKTLAAAVSDKTETIRDRASVCGCQLESFMAHRPSPYPRRRDGQTLDT